MPTMQDITLYPVLRYRGLRVYPTWWRQEGSEPVVRCLIGPGEVHRVTLLPEFERSRRELGQEGAKRYVGRDDPLFVSWTEALARQEAASHELYKTLVAEDWIDTVEGMARYVHVDELEKVEGEPPEGPF